VEGNKWDFKRGVWGKRAGLSEGGDLWRMFWLPLGDNRSSGDEDS